MKNVFVEAMLPELKGPLIYKSGRGTGSTAKVAISRAFGNLLKQLKGKRISTIKAVITITEAVDQREEL